MQTQESELGFLVHPEGGTHPGVVMFPDVWGLSDHYRGLATRLAGEGFAVLALDPYRKTGQPEIADVGAAMAWIRQLSDPLVLETVQEGIDHLAASPAVAVGPGLGITGFCMGGSYAILAACGCRGLAACVPFYGMVRYEPGLDPARKPRSPLDALTDLSCPVLGLYGAEDHLIPPADVDAFQERLAKTGQPYELEVYPGAGHAFMNDTRPEMYRPAAAADAFPKLVAFLRSRLSG